MTKRKLTAILSADAEGYSRLRGDDDALTVQTDAVQYGAKRSILRGMG